MNRSFEGSRNNRYNHNRSLPYENSNSYDNWNRQSINQCNSSRDSFVPLESSSPMNHHNRNIKGMQRSWRNTEGSDGFNLNTGKRQFYGSMPNSPYNRMNRGNHRNRMSSSPNNTFHRNNKASQGKETFNISDYFDPNSIFEDPWRDLMADFLAKSEEVNKSDDFNTVSQDSINTSASQNIKSDIAENDYNCSQELINSDTSLNLSAANTITNETVEIN